MQFYAPNGQVHALVLLQEEGNANGLFLLLKVPIDESMHQRRLAHARCANHNHLEIPERSEKRGKGVVREREERK